MVLKRLDYFIEKFNAGFITFVDENFGTDKRWLKIFLEEIKKRDVLWHVGGMRVNCISPEWIVRMKESGCTTIDFGMESGSQRILDIMEKVTTVEQNKNTVKWLVENNLKSVIRLVLGMPGETPETVQESSDFCGFAVEQSPEVDPNAIAINFARALPGTPLYETARRRGLIGPTLEDEEKYMLDISNKNATHIDTYLNYLDYPKLFIEKWYFEICNHTRNAYIDKWGLDNYWNILLRSNRFKNLKEAKPVLEGEDWDYFASQDFRKNGKGSAQIKLPTLFSLARQNTFSSVSSFYPRFFWRMRPFTMVFVIINEFRKHGTPQTIKLLREYLIWHFSRIFRFKTSQKSIEYLSLRKLLKKNFYPEVSGDNPAMVALRKGR